MKGEVYRGIGGVSIFRPRVLGKLVIISSLPGMVKNIPVADRL